MNIKIIIYINCLLFLIMPLIGETISSNQEINQIHDYWFGKIESPEDLNHEKMRLWFSGHPNVDQEIKEKFGSLVQSALDGHLDHWKESPKGRLALIILIDQFTRNIFRGTPEAFAFDWIAQEIVLEGLEKNVDFELFPIERVFFYLPLEHAEDLEIQKLSIEKFAELIQDAPLSLKEDFEGFYGYALKHFVVIEKFNRFPHRNVILGRESSLEEIEFLKGPNSSF